MEKKEQKGFSLIEVMIVVAIIGILSAIALPAYHDYSVRMKVTEGLSLSHAAKTVVSTEVASAIDLGVTADNWNNQIDNKGLSSKFVQSILIDRDTGVITIDYNGSAVGVAEGVEDQLTLSPNIRAEDGAVSIHSLETALSNQLSGMIDWACISNTSTVADARSLHSTAPAQPLLAKYAPAECR